MSKELNIKRVSEVIGEEYKKWRKGEVIKIKAQTGAGKTFFITGDKQNYQLIDYIEDHEKVIYVCNRIELKRQIKLDLLIKYDSPIQTINDTEIDYMWLDKLTQIRNVTIISYHEIAEKVLDKIYYNKNYNLQEYDYIICDECHFFLTDASFNNKTYLAFEELINKYYHNSIKILISATMEEVDKYVNASINSINISGWISNNIITKEYSTDFDYSYLDVYYFIKVDDIITRIKNDDTENKWLIFVTQTSKGEDFEDKLKKLGISCTFIKAGCNNEEKNNIITKSKFDSKVLITTKVLDNGVNIKDEQLKNLVVMAYDKVTFIQEIGRARIDINNAIQINLYIPCFSKKNFVGKLNDYTKKMNEVNLYYKNNKKFKRDYSHNNEKTSLFYLNKNNEWTINELGKARLEEDISFTEAMIKKFNTIPKYAYIFQQLSWLGLINKFDESKLIINEGKKVNIDRLEKFLSCAYENNEKFTKEYFLEKFTQIINDDEALKIKFNSIDGGNSRRKGIKKVNEFLNILGLNFVVGSKKYKINKKIETKYIILITD